MMWIQSFLSKVHVLKKISFHVCYGVNLEIHLPWSNCSSWRFPDCCRSSPFVTPFALLSLLFPFVIFLISWEREREREVEGGRKKVVVVGAAAGDYLCWEAPPLFWPLRISKHKTTFAYLHTLTFRHGADKESVLLPQPVNTKESEWTQVSDKSDSKGKTHRLHPLGPLVAIGAPRCGIQVQCS